MLRAMTIGQQRRKFKAECRRVGGPNTSIHGPWSSGTTKVQLSIAGSREAPLETGLALALLQSLPDGLGQYGLLVAWYSHPELHTEGYWESHVARARARLGC
jgi:hypothetical protein